MNLRTTVDRVVATPEWHRESTIGMSESGQAAGLESVPFGILVFIAGVILVVNLWAVVDTRAALDGAARDYLRAYTSAPSAAIGRQRGAEAATAAIGGRRREFLVRIEAPNEPFGPCRPATVTIELEVPAIRAPFLGSMGHRIVRATQTELVQAYGAAASEPSTDRTPTPCDN